MQRFSNFRLQREGAGTRDTSVEDLVSRLRFATRDGHVWLDHQRMFLFHAGAYSTLRREICDAVGLDHAKLIFSRVGHATGELDAQIALRVRKDTSDIDTFLAGPQLHTLEGVALVEPVSVEIDAENGRFDSEFIWRNSLEAHAHVTAFGIGSQPVCWCQTSHASGYTSYLMKRKIVFREVECVAKGDPHCRIVGRTLEQWENSSTFHAFDASKGGDATVEPLVAPGGQLVGQSTSFVAARELADRIAKLDTPVLLLGETGVGKERFAQAIHAASGRSDRPFHAVNCSALPETLLEAELFGVERGAYTGATSTRQGWFETCGDGTLLLDEIGSISPNAQSKLLRVIQEREFVRVGSTVPRETRARLIFATSENLQMAVSTGNFRKDLLYRINAFPIHIPPLRERREDILPLCRFFLKQIGSKIGRSVKGISPEAADALLGYDFPGNIRELQNMIERALILVPEGEIVQIHHLFSLEHYQEGASFIVSGKDGALRHGIVASLDKEMGPFSNVSGMTLREVEALLIRQALEDSQGNAVQAARKLGLSRSQFRTKISRLQIR